MKRKWINKAEINKLLSVYSIRADEFREVKEYTFLNEYVKGYMITIQEEFCGNEKTGRIIVLHTQYDGKMTYKDIWERDKENKLQFRFRIPWNCPTADVEYIKELEKAVEKLMETGKSQYEELQKNAALIDTLYKKINEIEKNVTMPKHNARNAGRKKADKKWTESFVKFIELYESQKSINEIMDEMQISRATYYRYKKLYVYTNHS